MLRGLLGALLLSGCSKPELTIWSAYPGLEERFSVPAAAYKKINLRFRPLEPETDVTDLESGFFVLPAAGLDRLIEAGLALDMTEPAAEAPEDGTAAASPGPAFPPSGTGPRYYREGRLYGIFLDAGTGALCYDPALTENYLGLSEPAAVQKRLGDLNAFIAAADVISRRSSGLCAIIPRAEELGPAFRNAGASGMTGLDEAAAERWFADTAELFRDRRWEGLEDEGGNPRRTVFVVLPPGGLFVPPAAQAGSDWRVIPGPGGGSGGVWLALHRDLFTEKQKRRGERIREYLGLFLRSAG
ncbi:MAG: hypothetical protein LBD09_00455 [Treponema sp.]|nr:hypothetical protein [Treponema sp.]